MSQYQTRIQQKIVIAKYRDNFRTKILRLATQEDVISFDSIIQSNQNKTIEFLDSGSYGSVFRMDNPETKISTIFKLVACLPERIKKNVFDSKKQSHSDLVSTTYADGYNEIKILHSLSHFNKGLMSKGTNNRTSIFPQIFGIHLFKGRIPEEFRNNSIRAMHTEMINEGASLRTRQYNYCLPIYDSIIDECVNTNETLVLHMEQAGERIDAIVEKLSAIQFCSIFKQLCLGLMVAEDVFCFEHRDLHFGNLLISTPTDPVHYAINRSVKYSFNSEKVQLKLIDTTFSFLKFHRRTFSKSLIHLFHKRDIETLDLNEWGCGNMDVTYNQMAKEVELTKWDEWHPRTNLIWILYIGKKFLRNKVFKRTSDPENYRIRVWFESVLESVQKSKNLRELVEKMIKDHNQVLPIKMKNM